MAVESSQSLSVGIDRTAQGVTPNSEEELAEVVAAADGPLRIEGGGTRLIRGSVVGDLLETSGLSGIKLYEPAALTLIARSGTPVEEVEDALARERQCLSFEPMDHRGLLQTEGAPTIGGVAAANISGPRRIKVGACRDHMLGVRFVDGRGEIIKNGGRVMKNVTGYDLVKLLAGSHGTLGVITEIAFKVLPKPDFRGVLLIYGLSDAEAVRAMSIALGTPFNVTGASHVPRGLDGHPATMIRLEGFEEIVRSSVRRLSGQLEESGEISAEYDQDRTAAGWKWIRDVAKFHGLAGDVWRIAAKPSDGPVLADRIRRQCDTEVVYDWGGGLVWLLVPEGSDVRSWLGRYEGHATLVRANKETLERFPAFQHGSAQAERISAALKKMFDPRGILNTGLMHG